MNKSLFLAFSSVFMLGCTTYTINNQFSGNSLKDESLYRKIDHNVRWENVVKSKNGCSVMDFYNEYKYQYDDILDISITSEHVVSKFLVFANEKTNCEYKGTGVKFVKNEKYEEKKQKSTKRKKITVDDEYEDDE